MSDKRLALEGPKDVGLIPTKTLEQELQKKKDRETRDRKRKSRWDSDDGVKLEDAAVDVEKLASKKAQQIYLLNLEIRELTARMAQPLMGIPSDPRDRSPSPEPVYNAHGQRVNTRLERTKQKLQSKRSNAITKLRILEPTYWPPACMNYKCPFLEERIDIPQDDFPELNFLGLILGPRGSCLERLRERTKCTITLKGKGTKHSQEGEDGPMHLTISGNTREGVKEAGTFLRTLIKDYCNDPNGPKMLALRAQRKQEMQILNGTVRAFDTRCKNCAAADHRTWECQDTQRQEAIVCENCGGGGHPASDCKQPPKDAAAAAKANPHATKLDQEYASFLNDVDYSGSKRARTDWDWSAAYQKGVAAQMDLSAALTGNNEQAKQLMLTYAQQYVTQQYTGSVATQQEQQTFVQNYVKRQPRSCVRTDGPAKCPYHGRVPPYKDPFAQSDALYATWSRAYGAAGQQEATQVHEATPPPAALVHPAYWGAPGGSGAGGQAAEAAAGYPAYGGHLPTGPPPPPPSVPYPERREARAPLAGLAFAAPPPPPPPME